MSGIKYGAAMYPFVRCLASKRDICSPKLCAPRLAHEMKEELKSYTKHYCKYNMLMENGNRREACAKLCKYVSFWALQSLSKK